MRKLVKSDPSAGTDEAVFPFPSEASMRAASSVTFDEINGDLNKANKEIGIYKRKVDKVLSSTEEESLLQPFQDDMECFLKHSEDRIKELEKMSEKAHDKFKLLVRWFLFKPKGGSMESASPSDLFSVWAEFAAQSADLWKAEQRAAAKRKIEQAQLAKEAQQQKTQPRKLVGPSKSKLKLKFGNRKNVDDEGD